MASRKARGRRHVTTTAVDTGTVEGAISGRRGVSRPSGYAGRIQSSGRGGLSDAALGENNRGSGGRGAPSTGIGLGAAGGTGGIGGREVETYTRAPGSRDVSSPTSPTPTVDSGSILPSRPAGPRTSELPTIGEPSIAPITSRTASTSTQLTSATRVSSPTLSPTKTQMASGREGGLMGSLGTAKVASGGGAATTKKRAGQNPLAAKAQATAKAKPVAPKKKAGQNAKAIQAKAQAKAKPIAPKKKAGQNPKAAKAQAKAKPKVKSPRTSSRQIR